MQYLYTRLRYLFIMRSILSSLYLLVLFSIASISAVNGQEIKDKISNAYQAFSKHPALTNGIASLTVRNSKTGEIIFENNGQIGLPTASTLKVITSITALDLLGEDYTFKTNLSYTGEIDSLGVLQGDLIIEGAGDPTLGSDRYDSTKPEIVLEQWKEAIRQLGINEIQGRIVSDDHLYNGYVVPGTWMWTDIGNYYGAGLSSLNWRENKIGVQFTPQRSGQPASIKPIRETHFHIVNEVKTGAVGSGDQVYGYLAPYSEVVYLRGTYGQDLKKTIEISSPDPALDLALSLAEVLQADSIFVSDTVTTAKRLMNADQPLPASDRTLITEIESPPLGEIVYWFNQKSINLYGEALLKAIGGISANTFRTQDAAELVGKYWQGKLQISPSELHTFDGSGLSPQNRVTTSAMSKIMQYAKNRPWLETFVKSLPEINKMRMKSGTIGGVLGYTGYHPSSDGQEYTFSLLVNNYQGPTSQMRQHMFRLLDSLK